MEIGDIAILVLRGSNPVHIYASVRLQFFKYIYILDKETTLTRLRIVLRDSVFVHLNNLNDHITLLHGQPNLVYDPCTVEGPFVNRSMSAFATRIVFHSARITQAEEQLIVEAKQ